MDYLVRGVLVLFTHVSEISAYGTENRHLKENSTEEKQSPVYSG